MSRWDAGVTHSDEQALQFIKSYFNSEDRRVLIIGAAGFDPRSTMVTSQVSEVAKTVRAIFIREERPEPKTRLVELGAIHAKKLSQLVPNNVVLVVDIFDPLDGAVVGAKRMVREVARHIKEDFVPTDIVVDLSALSIGMGFPLVKYLYDAYGKNSGGPNIHLFVAEDTELDTGIVPEHADQAMYVPGFHGSANLDENATCTKLWIPQLVSKRNEALRRIHDFVDAEETCPILPFPSKKLRRGDELLEEFITEVVDSWSVDPRGYLYAAEREPLDLYRILIRLDDARKRVYRDYGGSQLVLSPVGSKVLALGALLAALEREFPVAYLESVGYSFTTYDPPDDHAWPLVHVWLSGEVYA